jgi:UDP-glucose 4-epimerase
VAKYLVTGGSGFIGSHLVETLLRAGHDVRVLDDFSTGRAENLQHLQGKVDLQRGSILDADAVRKAVRDREVIFHLAALPSVSRSVEEPLLSHQVCATGTVQVLDEARKAGVRRVVYAASSSAYGDIEGAVRREDEPVSPLSPYAAAKLAGEHYCRCFTKVYNLETVRMRFFNIFGPRQDPKSPYTGVIALFISAMVDGRPVKIEGDGLQSRDFTYVANAVQACIKAADAPGASGNVYNVGTGGSTTVLDLVKHLNQILGLSVKPEFVAPRPGDVRHSQADISRARRDLRYEPDVSFAEGLRRTLEWYRSQR